MRDAGRDSAGVSKERCGVLLLAHGAPDRLEDIPEFLLHVRGGRKLPDAAVEEVKRRYALVGGGSPLLRETNRQAEALAETLGQPVFVGMRNWKPFISESVRRLTEEGIRRVVALCLAPQNSRTSVGLYRERLRDAVEKFAPRLDFDFVESWHDQPDLIAAFREKISRALDKVEESAGERVPVIFTAHSVPARTIADGDRSVAFQSQGMTDEPWIGPTVESEIDRAAAGHRHVLIAPVGFVCDHVEILYDIDVVLRDYGRSKGVTVSRSESLNHSPLFIRALASIVGSRVRGQGWG